MVTRIGQEYNPDQAALTVLFQTDLITANQAEVFARALEHFWAGRFDESIHIALPRVEGVLRRVLVALGGVSYKEPPRGQFGGDKTLGVVLDNLSQFLPEAFLHPFRFLLTDRAGLNLRNNYLHGLVAYTPDDQALQQDAALILWIAARLRLPIQTSADSPAGDD